MRNKKKRKRVFSIKSLFTLFFSLCLTFTSLVSVAATHTEQSGTEQSSTEQDRKGPYVENSLFSFRLIPRTPEQMAAFYEARGFPKSATALIKKTCYFTAVVNNKSQRVIWLDLKYWRFYNAQKEIRRIDRQYWNTQWEKIKLPQAHRSTFGWTLLPEIRNLLPNEHVGGNIVIPSIDNTFTLEALFITGQNRRGGEIRAELKNIRCQKDEDPQT